MELKGAVCIVTGSSAGIGAASAELLASKGARVVINYTKSEAAAKAVAKTCQAKGAEVLLVQADIAADADCQKLARAALDKWGRIDGLINNAGATKFAQHSDLDALQAADFQRIFGVNVVGTYQMTRAVAKAMKAQGRGAVVNISSIAGVMGLGSSIAYAASKGAINTMTLSLARALGPEIRVNTVCPGMVETRWLQEGLGEAGYAAMRNNYVNAAPLRKPSQAEDIAEVAVWLLEGADLVTGEILMVDGGFHLGATPLKAR